jgi:hypothetical protein
MGDSERRLELEALWERTLREVGLRMSKATFDTWLKYTSLVAVEEDEALGISTPRAVEWACPAKSRASGEPAKWNQSPGQGADRASRF